jgi:hypothetical protein
MDLPFSAEQFLDVFRNYNHAIWPAQIIAYLLGIAAVLLVVRPSRRTNRFVGLILSAMWFWMGAVYHISFFSEINAAAYVFGAFFIAQGVLFLMAASGRLDLDFRFTADAYGITGAILTAYALVIYPILGAALGHGYPYAPVFGVTPCPTTIFTFGLLLWTKRGVSGWLFVIPGLWAVIGFMAAISLGIREDVGLLAAAVVSIGMIFLRRRRAPLSVRA